MIMGLTKQYLRYIPAANFNIIASSNCNAVFVTLESQEGRFVAVGACEHIFIWDLRLGEKAQVLPGEKSVVTSICASPNKRHLAAGYSDGLVQVYDLKSAEVLNIFSGHTSGITALAYDSFGHKLASASKDTNIVVWDTVAEVGLYKLSGHQGPVTQITFMSGKPILISSSKDKYVKFWDLDTQHCFKTLVEFPTEVWSILLAKDDKYLITTSGNDNIMVWELNWEEGEIEGQNKMDHLVAKLQLTALDDMNDPTHPLKCRQVGPVIRESNGRVVSMCVDASGQIIGCHGSDPEIELYYICSDEEAERRLKKRIRRQQKKAQNKQENETGSAELVKQSPEQETIGALGLSLVDRVKRLLPIKLKNKPKSVHLVLGNGGELRIATNLANNTIELYTLQSNIKHAKALCLRSIVSQGHRSGIKTVAFSSDNLAIVSGSSDSIKLWNRPSQTCLRTINAQQVLATIFVPGDRHVIAGLKDGRLLIINISVGDILEEISAHTKQISSICPLPDHRGQMIGCVTGSEDRTVKFWHLELITDEKSETKTRVLSLLHARTLKLEDNVTCVRISPNGKFLSVALLDSTVKIFYVDSFKLFLSLYGHKLPVLCMDISSDSRLIATGSQDRNVKIWGMDFGDCHRSLFAHEDSVTGLQFIPNTHYFFTCGRDGKIKQWDGDTYDKIMTLPGHAGEARALAVSPNGKFVVSCGGDNVLRLYEKSEEVLVLEDEEEEEREQEEALATGEQTTTIPSQPRLNIPSKKTVGSEKAAESILDCLEICEQYTEQLVEYKALQAATTRELPIPPPLPLMQAFNANTPEEFLLETIKRIRHSDMEQALTILPFHAVCELLQMLPNLVTKNNTELICKVSLFLVKLHYDPIVANQALLPTLRKLQKLCSTKVKDIADMIGLNLYGMQFIQNRIEMAEGIQLFRDATIERKKGEKKKRQREKLKKSVTVLTT